MRHRKQGRKLGRTSDHRKALFSNMAKALLTYGRIKTTVAKAKELSRVADGLVTLALRNDLHARRQAFKVLGSHQLVKKLFDEIGPCFAGAPTGGYTRIVKLALPRPGDAAPLAFLEFSRQAGEQAAPSTKKGKAAAQPAPAAPAETKAEPVAEAPVEPEAAAPTAEAQEDVPAEAAAEAPVDESPATGTDSDTKVSQ